MFHKLTLSLTIVAPLLSGAGVAQAATVASVPQVAVHVAGRTPEAVRADVLAAARKVCAAASSDLTMPDLTIYDGSADDCVNNAVEDAMRQLAPIETTYVMAGK